MKAAVIWEEGALPVYGDFARPTLEMDEIDVSVTGAALSHVTRSRASGTHYSASAQLPFVPGIDGVGRLADGTRVYFVMPRVPFGSMAEETRIAREQCVPLPYDLNDVTAAAVAMPGMSSWAALTERARLKAGETVLVNGATGASGRLAVQIAKHLGAGTVIATGRNADALREVAALGADTTILLVEGRRALEGSFAEQFARGVDVLIDYLWGLSAERILIAAAKAGAEAALRSSAVQMMGSGSAAFPSIALVKAIAGVLHAAVPSGFRIAADAVPLSEVEQAWGAPDSGERTVFTIEGKGS